ncbi:MAG: cobalamin biosynthesis protein CobQ [Eubacterium sp.]|nr:cobalamin biosynthesis protein CobQ [Eubacterium sp.]
MELKIGWLFPDSLYLHGDRGNILALRRMAEGLGCSVTVEKIDFTTEDFTPMDYDFLFCSPGEIATFTSIVDFLKPYTLALKAYIKAGRPLLVTGTSIGLWGTEIIRQDGSVLKGLEILEVTTRENEAVYGDDLYYRCSLGGETMEIIGNQIQMADFESAEEESFGELIYGYGNSGKDRKEGFVMDNAVFTNTLGPVLVQNPWLTKAFLRIIAENQETALELSAVDTFLEEKSFATKKDFILHKTTYLTNCKHD